MIDDKEQRTADYPLLVMIRVKAGSQQEARRLVFEAWAAVKAAGIDVFGYARGRLDSDPEVIHLEAG